MDRFRSGVRGCPPMRWAPRVPMDWLQQLYEQDAAGIVDEELIDKVGFRLRDRARDCIAVADSVHGRFACPVCQKPVDVPEEGSLRCFGCGWTFDLESFRRSWRHMELNADPTFLREFVGAWGRARTARAKMLAINDVIHRWHHETKIAERGGVGRPLGVNLIEGSRKQVIGFLDRLTEGPDHDRWSRLHEGVKRRTKARR